VPVTSLSYQLCALRTVLVAVRNWRSTAVRTLLAPLLFLSLTWVVNEVRSSICESRARSRSYKQDVSTRPATRRLW